jgi:hypothetical protein
MKSCWCLRHLLFQREAFWGWALPGWCVTAIAA